MKKFIRNSPVILAALLILGIGYLWLTFASPYGYHPTGDRPAIDENASYSIFVYGTLKKPWVRWLVMGRAGNSKPAALPDFRKDALNLKSVPGAVTKGQVIIVSGAELRALDRYERLGVRYERVELTLKNGESAWVYRLMDPLRLELSDEISD